MEIIATAPRVDATQTHTRGLALGVAPKRLVCMAHSDDIARAEELTSMLVGLEPTAERLRGLPAAPRCEPLEIERLQP